MDTKGLEFIQGIINRLASNSFQMKGWNAALATAAVGFAAAKDSRPAVAVLAVVPALALWGLDGYYLASEKLYRKLYEETVAQKSDSLNLNAGQVTITAWVAAIVSRTVLLFHSPMVVIILLVTLTGVLRRG